MESCAWRSTTTASACFFLLFSFVGVIVAVFGRSFRICSRGGGGRRKPCCLSHNDGTLGNGELQLPAQLRLGNTSWQSQFSIFPQDLPESTYFFPSLLLLSSDIARVVVALSLYGVVGPSPLDTSSRTAETARGRVDKWWGWRPLRLGPIPAHAA